MSEWIAVNTRKPRLNRDTQNGGKPFLIWPMFQADGTSPTPFAYYGTRYGDGKTPVFYIYGREVYPTHWMPLPDPPRATSTVTGEQK